MTAGEIDLIALEALIFASDGPCSAASIRRAFPELAPGAITPAVAEINARLLETGRPYEIAEVAAGWQFRTRPEHATVILAAKPERKVRLSRAALETLAVVAYKQPATRAEVEHVRGVDVGAVLRSLVERKLVRIAGHREVPGRPIVYGTTKRFLEVFGLPALSDLPTLREIQELVPNPPEPEASAAALHASAPGAEDGAPPERLEADAELDEDPDAWEETLH